MSSVTVLSGPERRRRWSAWEKARVVEKSLQPGAVVKAVARRHAVHPNLLHHWRRQVRQAANRQVGAPAPAGKSPEAHRVLRLAHHPSHGCVATAIFVAC